MADSDHFGERTSACPPVPGVVSVLVVRADGGRAVSGWAGFAQPENVGREFPGVSLSP